MENIGVVLSVIFSVIFWGIVLVVLVRICKSAGIRFAFFEKLKTTLGDTAIIKSVYEYTSRKGFLDILKVFLFGLAARLFVYIVGYFVLLASDAAPDIEGLFRAFRAWDSHHYINIAQYGYGWVEYVNGEPRNLLLVFFPLYSFLIRLLSPITGDLWRAGYIISVLAFCAGLCYLYKLVKLDFGKTVAWWSILFLSFAPPAFFFGTPMTESLMILVSSAALYYIRTHKWALVGIFGALSMLTRMVGLIFIAVAIVEFISHYRLFELAKNKGGREIFRLLYTKGVFILLIPVGGLIYLFINFHISGDAFRFMYYQREHWHNATQYFGRTIIDQFRIIAQNPATQQARWIHLPNVLAFVFSIGMLAYACVKKIPNTYLVFVLGYIFISFAPAWLLSGARYMVACVPVFIFAGHLAEKKPLLGLAGLAASFAGMIVMLREFLAGGFVL